MIAERIGTLIENNQVRILTDTSCKMKAVHVNQNVVMEGNYHDFHNGCHGDYDFPEFHSARSLAEILIRFIKSQGKDAELILETYVFE